MLIFLFNATHNNVWTCDPMMFYLLNIEIYGLSRKWNLQMKFRLSRVFYVIEKLWNLKF